MPWREMRARAGVDARRDPWGALVSEAMLQQTQASRVIERFPKLIERFPTPRAMAEAGEDAVLAEWSGMGYYRRAKNLYAAARMIVEEFGGEVPRGAEALRGLPGVGRYTAGAVASIVFGEREAIVDGNVTRVLARLTLDRRDPKVKDEGRGLERDTWVRAGLLAEHSKDAGLTNEGLMELGATVCLPSPRRPECERCPVAGHCAAREAGVAEEVPPSKRVVEKKVVYLTMALVEDGRGRVLVEQRGNSGLWAGMWQPIGVENIEGFLESEEAGEALGVEIVGEEARVSHATTHRDVRCLVYRGEARRVGGRLVRPAGSVFLSRWEAGELALSSLHRSILGL